MKVFAWIALLALALLTLFAAANWSLVTAPASLDFLAFTVQGPLGLILLSATLLIAALFAIYALSLRTSSLVESKRHAKALELQRELADKAEASRFTALGTELRQECAELRNAIAQTRADTMHRVDTLEASLKQSLGETANALFANIGQVDDKLNRLVTHT
jgi:uncharacterized integral membrane protein